MTDWVNGNGDEPKTPSVIEIDGEDTKWGFQAKGIPEALRWFKLLLVDEANLPDDVRDSTQLKEARDRLEELEMSAVDAMAEYLKLFWSHCLERLKVKETVEVVNDSIYHVVVTLPAIWNALPKIK